MGAGEEPPARRRSAPAALMEVELQDGSPVADRRGPDGSPPTSSRSGDSSTRSLQRQASTFNAIVGGCIDEHTARVKKRNAPASACMWHPMSRSRIVWDIQVLLYVIYIALLFPSDPESPEKKKSGAAVERSRAGKDGAVAGSTSRSTRARAETSRSSSASSTRSSSPTWSRTSARASSTRTARWSWNRAARRRTTCGRQRPPIALI